MKNISKVLLFAIGSVFTSGESYMSCSTESDYERPGAIDGQFTWDLANSCTLFFKVMNKTLDCTRDFPGVAGCQCLDWFLQLKEEYNNLCPLLTEEDHVDFVRLYFFNTSTLYPHPDWPSLNLNANKAEIHARLIQMILDRSIIQWTVMAFSEENPQQAIAFLNYKLSCLGLGPVAY